MTFAELTQLLDNVQGSRCGVCGCAPTDRRLVVDHDHASGLVRGLLCDSCNTLEGVHHPCAHAHNCAICRWRQQPAVSAIGWTVRYESAGYEKRPKPLRGRVPWEGGAWLPTNLQVSGALDELSIDGSRPAVVRSGGSSLFDLIEAAS